MIRATTATILVAVSCVNPAAAVSHVEATASVRYVEATGTAQWIDAVVFAETTRPDVLTVDVVTVEDKLSLAAQKVLASEALASDVTVFAAAKGLADAVAVAETIYFGVTKPLADSTPATELLKLQLTKVLSEAVALTEVLSLSANKVATDAAFALDTAVLEAQKGLADDVAATDFLEVFKAFIREYDDAVVATDALGLTTTRPFGDAVAATDNAATTAQKGLADAASTADAFGPIQSSKVLADQVAAVETLEIVTAFVRSYTDTAAASEVLGNTLNKLLPDEAVTVEDTVDIVFEENRQLDGTRLNAVTLN